MSEDQQFRLDLKRSPAAGLSPDQVVPVRGALLANTADVFSLRGRLPDELQFVGEGYIDAAPLAGKVELGQEAIIAALLRSYGEPGEKVLRYRRGEVVIGGQRYAALLELVPGKPDRWWRALRRIGTGAAAVGVFHGPWEEREGTGLEALEDALHEWIDVSRVEVTGVHRTVTPRQPADDIRMAAIEVKGTLPDDPRGVAAVLGKMLDEELLAPGPKPLFIFAFRPEVLERWEVRGNLACTVEDLVRAIAAQGPVDAVAMVHPAVVDMPDGVRRRCWVTVVERCGRIGQRMMPLEFEGTQARALAPLFRDGGPVPPTGAWIGVKPNAEIDLHAIGPVDSGPGEVPEG